MCRNKVAISFGSALCHKGAEKNSSIPNVWETINTFTEEERQMMSEGLSTITEPGGFVLK